MTQFLYSIVFFVVAVGVLISFHEYGHFWVARRLGVSVLKFSIGFGPPLLRFRLKNKETEYVVAAIPLGGYVRMLDENAGEVPQDQLHRAFNRQVLWKRSAIVAAGPLFNFLLAGLLYCAVFLIGTEGLRPVIGYVKPDSIAARAGVTVGDEIVAVEGRRNRAWRENHFYIFDRVMSGDPVHLELLDGDGATREVVLKMPDGVAFTGQAQSWESVFGIAPALPQLKPVIDEVMADSPAQSAGLVSGDRVVEVDGEAVASWSELVVLVSGSPGTELRFLIERDGELMQLDVTPRATQVDGATVGRIGVLVGQSQLLDESQLVVVRYGPLQSFGRAIESTWSMTALTVKMLARMLDFSDGADASRQLGGPITIAKYAGTAAQSGVENYLTFLALLSISLGILNLLPIPVLDGGHLLFHLYEAVVGSPPSERVMARAFVFGIFMLAGIMGLAFYNDFSNL